MKLALNAAELVPSAIMDMSIADAARTHRLRDVMLVTGNEAVTATLADGCHVRPIFGMHGDVASNPDTFVETVLNELVANYILSYSRSTILQDWMKHRHSEVNEINGTVVSVLESAGQRAPANQAVVEFAAEIESGTRERGIHNLEPLIARMTELGATLVFA
jgi:2-dehydropantoate 2-reductase